MTLRDCTLFSWKKDEKSVPRKWTLFIDETLYLHMSTSIIKTEEDFKKIQNSADSVQDIQQKLTLLEQAGAYSWAMKQLARRAMFESEIQNSLKRHYVSYRTQIEVIEKLRRKGWVNDAEHCKNYIARLRRQGKSNQHIRFQLQRYKINSSCMTTGEAIKQENGIDYQNFFADSSDIFHSANDKDTLVRLIEKKYRNIDLDQLSIQDRNKLIQKFARRGFSISTILQVLQDLKINIDIEE